MTDLYTPPKHLPITEQLRLARIAYHISVPRLSLGLGLSYTGITHRETGRTTNLKPGQLEAWAEALGYRLENGELIPVRRPNRWDFPTQRRMIHRPPYNNRYTSHQT